MLLYHNDILSAINRLLCGAGYNGVLRLCTINHLLCLCARDDDGLLCSGTDDLLRADFRLLFRASYIHELLPCDIHLSLHGVLRELSWLAVVAISRWRAAVSPSAHTASAPFKNRRIRARVVPFTREFVSTVFGADHQPSN